MDAPNTSERAPTSYIRGLAAGALLLSLTAFTGCESADQRGPEPAAPVEKVSTVVPTQPRLFATTTTGDIPRSRFDERYDLRVSWYERGGHSISPADRERARDAVGRQLIYEELLRAECERLGLEYDEKDLSELKSRRELSTLSRERYLSHIGASEASLLARDIASLRESLLLEQPGRVPAVTEAEIDEEYARTKGYFDPSKRYRNASVVKIWKGKGSTKNEALELAQAFYEAASAPDANIAELVRPYADGEVPGGRGYVGRLLAEDEAHTSKWLRKRVFSAPQGRVSRPFSTRDWIFVVYVDAAHGRGTPPRAALERRIRRQLTKRHLADAQAQLQQELFERYRVELVADQPEPSSEEK